MSSGSDNNELGRYFQKPNLPIIVWFFSFLLSKLFSGDLEELFSIIAFGALFTWAWLEIFQGTNIFRRSVGSVVMIILIFSRLLQ